MREEQVWTLLVESNPVPDVDVYDEDEFDIATYLATLEERSSEVTQLEDKSTSESRSRSGVAWVAAAVAMILIGVVIVLTNSSGDESPVVTNPPQPVTTAAAPVPEVAAVLAALDAYNAGDAEAWRTAFDELSEEVAESWQFEGETYRTHDVMMAANEQLKVVGECELVSAGTVECLISETNDWHGKAGITHEVVTEFHLNDELLIGSWTFDYGCCDDEFEFNAAFNSWMLAAHPDAWEEIRAVGSDSFPGFERDPAHMATALEYVDEFLGQSDTYPVDNHSRVIGGEGE